LNRFSANYFILTGALIRELDTNISYINQLLANQGIKPISGKSVDGGYSYLYKRSDIILINFQELISNSRPANYKKRTKPGTLSLIKM
jgi:hypothetical protein